MEFVLGSLAPWERTSPVPFGLSIERSQSCQSSLGTICRQGSNSDIFGALARQGSQCDVFATFARNNSGSLEPSESQSVGFFGQCGEFSLVHQASAIGGVMEEVSSPDDTFDYSTKQCPEDDETVDSVASTPRVHSRRRARTDSSLSSSPVFEELDETRPWESESIDELNMVPEGFTLPNPPDFGISLGDLRVIGRFHVQKVANELGVRLPAGMTNSDLVALAHQLGMYPLMYRLHLEVAGRTPATVIHSLYLEYKRESKTRAKKVKMEKDVTLAGHSRRLPNGKLTIDYFPGIALRLGRERDTIFRPLLHRVFREYKTDIRQCLVTAGLNYNEMRKWRDTQLCTALFVANQFQSGIWESAVNVHISKTKHF